MGASVADEINPKHYAGNYQPIDLIDKLHISFCGGNAITYISRAGRKEGESRIVDLDKALWYLNHLIGLEKDQLDKIMSKKTLALVVDECNKLAKSQHLAFQQKGAVSAIAGATFEHGQPAISCYKQADLLIHEILNADA